VSQGSVALPDIPAGDTGAAAQGEALQYEVEIDFNGPLFLACFFGPVLAFQGLGLLAARAKRGG
jgi:hypothetical protein